MLLKEIIWKGIRLSRYMKLDKLILDNMKSIYKILLFALCLTFSVNMSAQGDLTEEDKTELQVRVKMKVDEFQQYLSDIVNTNLSNNQRRNSITAALALFIGKGEAYTITDEYGETVYKNPVRMQISSINNDRKRWLPMTKYLENQYNNVHRYGRVVIESADAVRVDNIHKVADGRYQAVAYFCQKYIAYREGRPVYGDVTSKKVIVYISAIDTPYGYVWDAKLGDVYVTSTSSL